MKKVVPARSVQIPETAQCVFKGVIYDVYQWQQELFDGSKTTFEMLRRPDTVSAICIVDDKIVVLSDDQPHRGVRLSFPGGRADVEGEDALRAVKREVREETGYSFKQWKLVKVFQPQRKIEWFIYLFVAWDVKEVGMSQPDAGEVITPEFLSFEEVKRLAAIESDIGEAEDLFEKVNSISELIALPEFQGKEIEVTDPS